MWMEPWSLGIGLMMPSAWVIGMAPCATKCDMESHGCHKNRRHAHEHFSGDVVDTSHSRQFHRLQGRLDQEA